MVPPLRAELVAILSVEYRLIEDRFRDREGEVDGNRRYCARRLTRMLYQRGRDAFVQMWATFLLRQWRWRSALRTENVVVQVGKRAELAWNDNPSCLLVRKLGGSGASSQSGRVQLGRSLMADDGDAGCLAGALYRVLCFRFRLYYLGLEEAAVGEVRGKVGEDCWLAELGWRTRLKAAQRARRL